MYARTIENPTTGSEQVLTFGVSGKLIMNVLVMYDRQTDSYWGQLLGEALEGPLTGVMLTPIPASQTTWAEWKEQYPETQALFTNGQGRYDQYSSYYTSGRVGVLGESLSDDRLPTKELVTGTVVNDLPAAFPHSRLGTERAVNEIIGETAVTVWFDPQTATARIYERVLVTESDAEQILTFQPGNDPLEFVDRETGSTWLLLNGKAIAGPLEGVTLAPIPSTSSFWFGWKDWYPETFLYGHEVVKS